MSLNLTLQTVAILPVPGAALREDLIYADSGIQSAFSVSQGNDAIVNTQQYNNLVSGVLSTGFAFTLGFFVSPANALLIIAGIPALKSRLQAGQPGAIQDVVTWGEGLVFG